MRSVLRLFFASLLTSACCAASTASDSKVAQLLRDVPFSGPEVAALAFTPDGQTVFFTRHTPAPCRLYSSRRDPANGRWSPPEPAPFSSESSDDGDPFVAPDGSSVLFWSCRGSAGTGKRVSHLYATRRIRTGWSEPVALAPAVNLPGESQGFPCVTTDGTLYFFGHRPDVLGEVDLYRARRSAEGYEPPENLGPAVNSPAADLDGLVSPDGRFLVFCSNRPGGHGGFDLYVSECIDGRWTPARNAGPGLNSAGDEFCPSLSPDGRRFFFGRSNTAGSDVDAGTYEIDSAALGLRLPAAPTGSRFSSQSSHALAFGPDGTLYVGKERGIWRIDRSGKSEPFATLPSADGENPRLWSLTWHHGQLYGAAADRVIRVSAAGEVTSVVQEQFPGPCGVTDLVFDDAGNAYVAYANIIARYTPDWQRTVVLQGGATQPALRWVTSLCRTPDGRFWMSDVASRRVIVARLDAGGQLQIERTLDLPDFPEYLAVRGDGRVYVGFPDGNALARLNGADAPVLWRLGDALPNPVAMAFGGPGHDPESLFVAGDHGVTLVHSLP